MEIDKSLNSQPRRELSGTQMGNLTYVLSDHRQCVGECQGTLKLTGRRGGCRWLRDGLDGSHPLCIFTSGDS